MFLVAGNLEPCYTDHRNRKGGDVEMHADHTHVTGDVDDLIYGTYSEISSR
ncbi:MAG: hypothetical protein PUC06_10800 [Oscillospiraceae bacterium]|nr:hypothetical protein [Oscillospiraceae bacterium]